MAKRVKKRPIESVTASVASHPKVHEAEATSHVWNMSPLAEAVSRMVGQATIQTRRPDRQSDEGGAGNASN